MFAAFGALGGKGDGSVAYGTDGTRFMGATFDPTGLYRQAGVLDWMDEIGLTVGAIHDHVLALQDLFLAAVARAEVRHAGRCPAGHPIATGTGARSFLTFELAGAQALHDRLARANIVTDVRGERIRFGFGCYHTADEIEAARSPLSPARWTKCDWGRHCSCQGGFAARVRVNLPTAANLLLPGERGYGQTCREPNDMVCA